MADNIKQVKFKLTGDNTELLVAWAKARGAFNQLSEDLSATSKKFEELSEVEKRHFVKSQELALAEVELRRRIAVATKEIGEISERTSKLVTAGILKNKDAYKLLQDSARGYFEYVNVQATKIQQLTPSTLGATSTKEGTAPSVTRAPSNPNVYFDFAKNKVVNLKEKLEEEESAIKKSNQQKLESIKAYENHVASQEKETLERRKKFLNELDFQGTANLNKQKLDYQNTWNSLLKNEEEVQKKRQTFVEEFQQRQIQRNKELLDRQKFDEEASLNSRRVAQANLFNELLNKEEAQKKASTLAAQTKQQQEFAATKIREENLRKQVAAFQRKLSEEEAALKHSLRVQLQDHLTGIHSIEVARINSIEKIRQLEERRSRLTNINASRVQAGIITPEVGRTRQQTINNAFIPAIHAANIALAEQNKKIQDVAQSYRGLHTIVRDIIAGYAVLVSLQNTVVAAFQKFLEIGINLESVRASLTATAGSGARMENILVSLDKEAERTGIAIGTIRDSFKNLQASMSLAGESIGTTYKIFTNLDTVITALHLPAEKAQGIFLAIAQIFNKGKVQSEELVKQLGNLLPGAFAAFAAATGKSTLQLSKDMKNGLVFAHDTIEDFTSYMAQKFSTAFEISARSMNSELGRLSTSFTHLGESIYAQTNGPIIGFVRGLTSAITSIDSFVKGEAKFQSETRAGIELLTATIGVGLAGAIAKAALQSKFLSNSLKAITANPIGLAFIGAITIGEEFTKIRSEAENLEEYLTKQEQKHKLLKEQVNPSKNQTEQQKLDFKVSNVESVKIAQKEVEKLEKQITNFNPLLFSKNSETAQKRLIELQTQLSRAIKDYDEERKIAVQQIKEETEKNEALFLDQRQTDLNAIREGELENIDTIQKAREKGLLDYKKKYEDILSRQDQIIAAGTPHKRQDGSEADVSDKQIEAARVASETKKRIEVLQNEFVLNREKEFLDKKQSLADTATNKQIELDKKLFAQQEKEQKLSHDRRIQELEQFIQVLQLKQENPNTALGQSTFINRQLEINKQKLIQLDEEFAARQRITAELSKQVNLDALQVADINKVSDKVKTILPIISRIETGGYENPYRAVGAAGEVGKYQFLPTTLQQLKNQNKINLEIPEFAFEAQAKTKRGEKLSPEEKEALANWAEGVKSILDQAFVEFTNEHLEHFKGDIVKTIAAHNAGQGGVDNAIKKGGENYQEFLPAITKNYLNLAGISKGTTTGGITKSEAKAIVQTSTSDVDQEQLKLDYEKQRFVIQLDSQKLEQQKFLVNKEVGNEILQQLILQKQASGELEQAAILQDMLENSDKRRLLSLDEEDGKLSEQNKRLLSLLNSTRDRNREEGKLTEILNKQSIAYTNLQFELDKINNRVQTGLQTPFGEIQESADKAAEAAKIKEVNMPNIIAGINKLRDEHQITPLQANQQIIDEQRGLLELQTQAKGVENYFRTNLASAFEAPFKNLIEGKTNAIGALKEFGVAILSLFEELIVKELALAAAKAAVSAASSGFSILGGLFSQGGEVGTQTSGVSYSLFSDAFAKGGQVLNFPTGGLVKGPGTETSDSIKAVVPKGSYIIKASSVPAFDKAAATLINVSKNEKILPPNVVQLFGKEKLDQINTSGKFATGGFVGTNIPASPTNSGVANIEGMSYTNHYSIQVNVPEGKMSREEAKQTGNDIAVAMMQKIAKVEAAKQISIYDKTRSMSNRKG